MSKKLSLLLAALFMFVAGFAQEEVWIGSATTTNGYAPANTYYEYSIAEMIYLNSEIGMSGNISSISFKGNSNYTRDIEIYLAENSIASFSSASDALPDDVFTLVYSGSVNFVSGDWTTIEFDTPFLYKGTGNLLVGVRDMTGSWKSSTYWTSTSTTPSRTIRNFRDGTPFTFSNFTDGANSGTASLPDVKLEITPLDPNYCAAVKGLTVGNITSTSANFSWTAGGEETKWRVQITTADDENWTNTIASTQVTSTSYTRTGLNPQTSYKARVQAMCAASDAAWKTVSFQTPCVAMEETSLPYNYGFENNIDFSCYTVLSGKAEIASGETTSSYGYPAANSGTQYLRLDGNGAVVLLPAINVDLKNLRLRFAVEPYSNYDGDCGSFEVGLITDNNVSTFKSIKTISLTEGSPYKTIDWVTFANETGTAAEKNIAIKYGKGYASDWGKIYIDDIAIEQLPDCPAITGNLVVDNETLTDEGVTLKFTDEEGQDSWNLFYKTDDAAEYTQVALTTNTYALTNLNANTTYSAYVARTCNVGKKIAESSNIVTFTTKYNCDKISGTLALVDTLLDATTATLKFKDTINTAWTLYYKTADDEEYSTVEISSDAVVITGEGENKDTAVYVTLDELTVKANYVAYVTASCEGIAEPSNTVSFSTKALAIDLNNLEDKTYFVDFDNNNPEADNYVIGSTSTTNAWVIGTATGNEGKSLYISNNGGTTNAYSTNSATKAYVAFRVKFLEGINTYNLSFDYKAPTTSDHNYDDFKAAIIDDNVNPANTYTGSGNSWTFNGKKELVTTRTSSDRTSDWKSYAYMFGDAEALAGTTKWVVFWFNCDGSVGNGSAPAIDNFQIKAGVDCSLEANKQYTEQNIFICAGDETNKMTPGDYVTVVPTVEWGCDSTITLHVQIATDSTVEAPIDVFDTELPYIMNGHEYAQAGTYTDSVATDGGCYNLTHFTLNVIPSYNTDYSDTLNVVLCEGQNYTVTYFDYETEETVEEVLTEARTYVYELKSILGSDSIVIVDLKLNPVYKIELEPVTLCLGEVYDANGFYKKENRAGEYDYTLSLKTVNDCDSIITVHVTVNPVYNDTVELTVKSSEEQLVDNGRVVLDELPFGIDTISAPSTKSAFETYTKTDALQTINGCDSLVTYNYTVLRSYYDITHTHVVICNGETYTVEYPDYTAEDEEDLIKSVTYSTTTNSTLNLVAFNGADSVLKIDVTVLGEMDETTVDTNICFGGVFELDGVEYTENGIYKTTLQTEELGCDSVVAYNVTFLDNYVHHDDIVINEGTTYTVTWDGGSKELTAAGEYTLYNTKTVSGDCDSIYTVTLTVRTTQRDTTSMGEFCKGDASVQPGSKTVEGFEQLYLADGDYSWYKENHIKYTDVDSKGEEADSIVNVIVFKVNDFDVTIEKTICSDETVDLRDLAEEGDVYVSGDKVVSAAGTHTATFTRNGCQYVMTLNLTVNEVSPVTEFTETICEGKTYSGHGFTGYTATGNYTRNLKNYLGCDSTVVLHLTVLPNASKEYSVTMKEGETYTGETYGFDASFFEGKTRGTYTTTKIYPAYNTCDSVVTLTLTVNPVYKDTILAYSYCNGSLPAETPEGFTLAEDGNYYRTVNLVASDGNDSILYFKMAINETYNITEEKAICTAELPYTYKYKGKEVFDAPLTAAGTFSKTFQTENGCDSTITLTLTVNNVVSTTLPDMVYCQSETDEVLLPTGQTITPSKLAAGTYEYSTTLKTYLGCDSVVTMNLVINALDTTYKTVAHSCSAPSEADFILSKTTEEGVKVWTKNVVFTKAETGCDSIVVLTIYQHPTFESVIKDTVCQGVEFARDNFEVTAAETAVAGGTEIIKTQNLQTVEYGCDSIVTLKLFVKKAYTEELENTKTFTKRMAVGETFKLDNSSFEFTATEEDITAEGEYKKLVFDTTTYNGCDSVVVINMEVIPAIDTIFLTIEQCQTENGTAKPGVSGVYTNHRANADGLCDTVTITTITINPMYNETIKATICAGQTYTANEIVVKHPVDKDDDGKPVEVTYTLDEPVVIEGELAANASDPIVITEERSLQTEKGCDVKVKYEITVLPVKTKVIYDTICANSNSIVPGFEEYNATGVYTKSFAQAGETGCDSTVTLNLYVRSNYAVVVEDEIHIYDNDTYVNAEYGYTWTNDIVFDAENPQIAYYTDNMVNAQTAEGCDSVVTLKLAVVPYTVNLQTIEVCSEEAANNTQLSMERFVTADGIDSIVTYAIEIVPLADTVINAQICEGASYAFFDETLTAAVENYKKVVNEDGCTRNYFLNLTVTDAPEETIEETICEGETFVYNGEVFTESGNYERTITDNGCTKKININLTVNPVYSSTETVTICEGSSYNFDGTVCTTSGLYTKTYKSINGCDSVVNVVVVVTPTIETSETATICEGSSYTFHGQTYTTAGTYTATYKNENGCDVTATLTLNVNSALTETVEATICAGESYTFNGKSYTNAGTYTDTYKNENGCDVTATLKLNVNNVLTSSVEATICEGSSYEFNGKTLTEAGTYEETFTSINGCDSVVTLTLNVNSTINETVNATICEGSSYSFYGQDYTTEGTYTTTYKNNDGCDVLVTLNLTVNSVVNSTEEATICEGTSYTFNNQTLTTAGVYTATYKTENGCDSIVTLTLNVNEKIYDTVELSVCEGETYELDGETYTAKVSMSGTYTFTSQSEETGCDSVTVVILTVNPTEKTVETAVLPFEGTYEFNGKTYDKEGVYTETLQTVNGCDSVVTLVLQASGLMDVENNLSVNVYPNPTHSDATLTVEGLNKEATITVTDVQGRVIYTDILPKGQTTITIPSSTMAAGYYNVNIIVDKDRVRTTKLLRK